MGVHAAGTQHGLSYKLAPLEGKRAPVLIALMSRAPAAHVSFQPLQALIWQIAGGLSYSQMPPQSQRLIDELIPEFRNRLSEDFITSLQKTSGEIREFLKRIPGAGGGANAETQAVNTLIQRYQQIQQNLRQYANNYEALAQSMVHVLPGTAENARPSSWSRVNPRVYVRLADGNFYGQMDHLQIRVLPSNARVTSAPRHSGSLQAASYNLTATDLASDAGDLADVPLEAVIGYPNAQNMQGLGWTPVSVNPPVITNVSAVLPQPNQTITITGSGFGTQPPYNGDSPYIQIGDLTGNWYAGHSGNWVTLNVQSWTDTQIVLGGFTGQYGMSNWSLNPWDQVQIQVWNAQSGAGPAEFTTCVNIPASKVASSHSALLLGAWLGQWPTRCLIQKFESDSCHHADIVNIFTDWSQSLSSSGSTSGSPSGLSNAVQAVYDDNALPMITWQPMGICDRWIVNGDEDAYIKSFAQAVAALGKPILIRPMHEMNGFWYSWSVGYVQTTGPPCKNTDKLFIEAWKHIVGIFDQAGASNAQFVWCINNYNWGFGTSYTGAYPGDRYVSYVGIDGYNWGNNLIALPPSSPIPGLGPLTWQSFKEVFSQAYEAVTARTSKPILITEWASAESAGSKPQWITRAFDLLRSGRFPQVVGLVWFNQNKERDWPIESSASAQAAYCAGANGASSSTGSPIRSPTAPSSPPSHSITRGGIPTSTSAMPPPGSATPLHVAVGVSPTSVTEGGQAVVSGVVRDAEGNAVTGAEVKLTASEGGSQAPAISATTGPDGSFHLTFTAPPTPGQVVIQARLVSSSSSVVATTILRVVPRKKGHSP